MVGVRTSLAVSHIYYPTAISISQSTASIYPSNTIQLNAIVTPSKSFTTITWSSSDTSVATVSQSGLVTSVSVGSCTITVSTDNGLSATCTLTVQDYPYLSFTAEQASSSVKLSKSGSPTAISLETSTDGTNWNDYTFGTNISLASVGDKVYWRNKSTTTTQFSNSSNYYYFTLGGKVASNGDINYLINKNSTTTLSGQYTYYLLFRNQSALTKPPKIPATTLTIGCYYYMFEGCTNLEYLPKLPATTLPHYCYEYMFQRCSKIKMSASQTGDYQNAYRIPFSGTGTTGTNSLYYMFYNTGGTWNGTPNVNQTYYTSNEIIG